MEPRERLELQQLLQIDFWNNRKLAKEHLDSSTSTAAFEIPTKWSLTQGIELHDWQRQCVDTWFDADCKGVLKVVTGAGKTILGLAITEKLQRTKASDLRVAIVVPTIVLLAQWKHELAARSNLPTEAIGFVGGGFNDNFADKRILVCVLNSASKKLPALVRKAGVGQSLLLIVDECHRAGASEMRRIFETERAFSLGLSATPEREADAEADADSESVSVNEKTSSRESFTETLLGQQLGPVIFELNYAKAVELGVLPPFRIVHYGLNLTEQEKSAYDKISREISLLRQELERPNRRGLGLIRWCRSKAASQNPSAQKLLALSAERKRLLFRMQERTRATLEVLRRAFAENPTTRAILFHENIDQVMGLFATLRSEGFPVVAEHSELPEAMRATSLELFRDGVAQIVVSARSLIEGFNVPSADLGIVVAASSSVRQRIQTLGRLLRKSQNPDGTEKQATLYVLYAAETVDEVIYEKADWEEFVGANRNSYFVWRNVSSEPPIEVAGPPRKPSLGEETIEPNSLQVGSIYPGNLDEGLEYTRDSQGTIRTASSQLTEPHPELAGVLQHSRKQAGRFRVTPIKRYVIELEKSSEGWHGLYLGQLTKPLRQVQREEDDFLKRDWKAGEEYPLSKAHGETFSVLQRDPRLIARKDRGNVSFVIPLERIADESRRKLLSDLQEFLKKAYNSGHRISKITVTPEGHVVYVFNNVATFAGMAPEGPRGFLFESD